MLEVTAIIGSRHKSEYKQAALGGNFLFLLTSENRVLRQRFGVMHGSVSLAVERDDVTPAPPHHEFLNAIFPCRQSGDCLVVSKEEDTLYVSATGSGCVLLQKLHGFHVISALWLDWNTQKKLIALGTKQGNVLEIALTDTGSAPRDLQVLRLLDLESAVAITYLAYEPFSGSSSLACVYMATCSGLYFLIGPSTTADSKSLAGIFNKYKDNPTKLRNALSAAPSPGESSFMQLFQRADGTAESFVFLSGSVVMFSSIPEMPETEGSCIVEIRSLPLPNYMKTPPQGCSISAYYLYLLYQDRLLVFSRSTLQLVSSTLLSFSGCYYKGLTYDHDLTSLLVWSNQVFTVQLEGEARLQWTLLMEQGKFEEALVACRLHAPRYLPKANGLYADSLVQSGDLEKAVDFYIDSDKQVEDVVAVLGTGRLAPLKRYLEACYDRLEEGKVVQKHVIAQMMLALVLVMRASQADVQVLFRKCAADLDFGTTTQALQTAARLPELVLFCREKRAFHFLFRHYLNGLDYFQALDTLPKCTTEEIASALAETALIFVQTTTGPFFRALIRLFHDHLDLILTPIIPAIRATPETYIKTAADFLHEYIESRNCKDQEVHNCYLYHLTSIPSPNNIESYLSKQGAAYQKTLKFDFDPDFAVALLREKQLNGPLVRLLAHLFRFREAVDCALKIGELSLAEQIAAQPYALARQLSAEMEKVSILSQSKVKELAFLFPPKVLIQFLSQTPQRKDIKSVEDLYKALSKELWLLIAAWHSRHDDSTALLQLPTKCSLLTFPEIAPYLSPSVPFGLIREDVKATLQKYSEDIQGYKEDTKRCIEEAAHIKSERRRKENECIQGDVTQPCAICARPMHRESAFLFPCLHALHETCLLQFYKAGFNSEIAADVRGLLEDMEAAKTQLEIRDIRRRLVHVLATECCFCSDAYVETVKQPLADDKEEREGWDLSVTVSRK